MRYAGAFYSNADSCLKLLCYARHNMLIILIYTRAIRLHYITKDTEIREDCMLYNMSN